MIEALLKAYAQNGAWPSGKNWERTTVEHPARRNYVRLFGSWAAAVREAESEGLRILRSVAAADSRPCPEASGVS